MNTKKVFIISALAVWLGVSAFWMTGCQSTTQSHAVQPGQQVTLTGTLQQGTITAMGLASLGTSLHPQASTTPLVNYQLYCVTFENAPVGAKGTADNSGTFSLSIKSYTPFGCFVLDSNNQHVADLLFAGLGTTSGTYSGSIMLTNNANVGSITVDPSTGMAVVNVAGIGGVAGNSLTGTAFDPTGAWNFTCTSPAGDPVYSCPQQQPTALYLHRISGIFSSDGKEHYGMGVWQSAANFTVCGSVEGLSPTPGSTTGQGPGGQTVTLDSPDGPLQFAYDNVWQAAFSNQLFNTNGMCGASVTLTCSQVTNVGKMGGSDMVTYSDGNCQQLCYANGFYQIKSSAARCIEDRNYMWVNMTASQLPSTAPTSDSNTSFIDFDGHNPAARFMFGELIYASNTSASEVSTEYRMEDVYSPQENASYSCPINGVTKLAFSEVDANTIVGTVDQYLTLIAGSPTQCTSTAIPNNYVLQDLQGMHMMFRMTK